MIGAGKPKRISRQIAADSKQTVSVSNGRPLDDRNKTVTLTDDESMSAASPSRDEDPAVLINSGIGKTHVITPPTPLACAPAGSSLLVQPNFYSSSSFQV